MIRTYLRLELGPLYLELGRLDAEEEDDDAEPAPGTFAHNDTPLVTEAYGPGFRIVGPEHYFTDGP